jgi:hypothetical protein
MSAVVVKGDGELSCGHPPGTLDVQPSQTVLTVGGEPVLLMKDVTVVTSFPKCANTQAQCASVTLFAGGSRVLKVNGEPVVLQAAKGTTAPAGEISVTKAGQDRLTET